MQAKYWVSSLQAGAATVRELIFGRGRVISNLGAAVAAVINNIPNKTVINSLGKLKRGCLNVIGV